MFLVRSISRFSSVESAPGAWGGSGATPVGMLGKNQVERTEGVGEGLARSYEHVHGQEPNTRMRRKSATSLQEIRDGCF
jgi:hypothetical protein